jgi:transposase
METPKDISALKDLVSVLLMKVSELSSRILELELENSNLRLENEELRSRLKLNSKNSHKPPSSDGLSKKPGLPKSSPKPSGGQKGHKGNTLKMVSEPDAVVVHHASFCPCCSKPFTVDDVESVEQKRQVFDIPAPRMEVIEHRLGVITCCGGRHLGRFPVEVPSLVQYGPRIKGLSILLNNDYKLPIEKIKQLMGDLWDCSFNESTVLTANTSMYQALESVETEIKKSILASDVAHFDETGMRVEKKLHWFHVASTSNFTYLFVHKKRGGEALESENSVIKYFQNRAVHDCWKPYFGFTQCKHALCCAHLLRELTNLIEKGSKWAEDMHRFIIDLYHESEKATKVVADKIKWEVMFNQICQLADKEEPPPVQGERGKPKNTKGRNLLNRLVECKNEWLAFAFVENVPFSNNQAERDFRCVKTKQKVATNFQTFKGAQHYARIQSFVSTMRKHSMNVYQNIINALIGKTISYRSD